MAGGIVAQRRIYRDITETMGDTPLIQLNRVGRDLPARIVVKHEGFNPFNSVTDRIGAAMIEDALRDGSLRSGMIVVEPTSGNTGIGKPSSPESPQARSRGLLSRSLRARRTKVN